MADISTVFPDNALKPLLEWFRVTVGRSNEHAVAMQRLREQHVRWTAGIATGGIALIVANWTSLAATFSALWLVAAMGFALASVAAAAATTYFAIELEEETQTLHVLGDGI